MPLNPSVFRRRHNYYLASATELVAPLLRAGSRAITGPPSAPGEWREGLILSHSHLGDVLYRTCSLDHLRERLPNCRWSYLVTPAASDVLHGNPAVDDVLPLLDEASGRPSAASVRQLRRRFDVVLCTNTFRIGADLRLALELRAPNRVAFDFKGLGGLVSHRVALNFPRPYPDYFRQMVASLTGGEPGGELRPKVYPTAEDRAAATAARARLALPKGPFIVCAPGARQTSGAAPAQYIASVLRTIAERFAGAVVLVGSRSERAMLADVAAQAAVTPRILAGDLNVRALAAFLAEATAALTQDSGPRHLANAAAVPVFFFRNLAVPRLETGTYCSTETDLAPGSELLNHSQSVAEYAAANPEIAAATVLAELATSGADPLTRFSRSQLPAR